MPEEYIEIRYTKTEDCVGFRLSVLCAIFFNELTWSVFYGMQLVDAISLLVSMMPIRIYVVVLYFILFRLPNSPPERVLVVYELSNFSLLPLLVDWISRALETRLRPYFVVLVA